MGQLFRTPFRDKLSQVIAVLFQCNTFVDHKWIISYVASTQGIGAGDNAMEATNDKKVIRP
jgi:hypothetical protein